MSTIRLSAVDIALVVGYLVGITILGVWLGREIRGGRDFFLAGKSLPW